MQTAMLNLLSKKIAKTSWLNTLAWLLASGAMIICAFIPEIFITYPASIKTLTFFALGLSFFTIFLIGVIRRRKLIFRVSPLSGFLLALSVSIIASILINNFFQPTKTLLGIGGLLITFCCLSLLSGSLLKLINGQRFIKALLWISTFFSLISVFIYTSSYSQTLPKSVIFLANHYEPQLYISVIFIGLGCCASTFFKKAKLKKSELLFLPCLLIGLACALSLQLQVASSTPSNQESWQVFADQIINDKGLQFQTLLIGSKRKTYDDIYAQSALSNHTYQQASNLPLTILSLFGSISVVIWLGLLIKTGQMALSKKEKNGYLYFVLFISFIVQIFTPIYPLILIIQIILIAISTDIHKKFVLNFNFLTIVDQIDGKHIEKRHNGNQLVWTTAITGSALLLIIIYQIAINYLGYYHHQKALIAGANSNIEQFYNQSIHAAEIAPQIDTFQRYAAIANLEMLAQLSQNNEVDAKQIANYFNSAKQYAQQAVQLDPYHADNYLTLAQTYQEIYPYFADKPDTQETLNKSIPENYSKAALYAPANINYLLGLAGFYQSIAENDSALRVYQQVLATAPDNPIANFQLAAFYEQNGDNELARSTYENTLKLLDKSSINYQTNKQTIEEKLANLKNESNG